MSPSAAAWLLISIAFISANLPWLSERIFLVYSAGEEGKRAGWRWLEWLVLYVLVGLIALGLEQKLNGERYPQGWEFYIVTFCMFLVFALPGFIYRHDLRYHLQRGRG